MSITGKNSWGEDDHVCMVPEDFMSPVRDTVCYQAVIIATVLTGGNQNWGLVERKDFPYIPSLFGYFVTEKDGYTEATPQKRRKLEGNISFPAGKLEPEDNGDVRKAAVRELREELKISIGDLPYLKDSRVDLILAKRAGRRIEEMRARLMYCIVPSTSPILPRIRMSPAMGFEDEIGQVNRISLGMAYEMVVQQGDVITKQPGINHVTLRAGTFREPLAFYDYHSNGGTDADLKELDPNRPVIEGMIMMDKGRYTKDYLQSPLGRRSLSTCQNSLIRNFYSSFW